MSQLGKLARDAAFYFGLGDHAARARVAGDHASWVEVFIRVVPPLLALSILRRLLPLDGGLAGLVAQFGLVIVLAVLWSGVLLMTGRRRRIRR